MSIDDFYKVHGYACFYKSDTKKVNEIDVKDMTITFVSHGYPRELLQHLMQTLNYKVEQQEEGIYYIFGDMFFIQLLVTSRLSKEQNLWMKSLTNKIKEKEQIQTIIEEYGKHKNNKLYKAVMNLIVRANEENFKEAN